MKIETYVREDLSCPFAEWLDSLPGLEASKVTRVVMRLEAGNDSNVKWFSGIGEYKLDWGPGYRIYLARDGAKLIVLLAGGTKKTQGQDIDMAKGYFDDYKRRKKAAAKASHSASRATSARKSKKVAKE